MGDITEVKRRFFHGLDADLPAAAANGDRYYATDKSKLYYWTAAGWKTGLGYEYVTRRFAADDFDQTDFTADGAWHVDGLDLSAIVPAEAISVKLKIYISDDAANTYIQFRPNATDTQCNAINRTYIAGLGRTIHADMPIDSDRLVDYLASNLVITQIIVSPLGWFI